MLLPIPAMTLALFFVIRRSLSRLPTRFAQGNQYGAGVPFASTVGIFLLSFYGLAYSLFPWLVIDKINIWQAASSPEALMVIFYGVVLVLTVSIGYTVFAYRVFWGKSTQLRYWLLALYSGLLPNKAHKWRHTAVARAFIYVLQICLKVYDLVAFEWIKKEFFVVKVL